MTSQPAASAIASASSLSSRQPVSIRQEDLIQSVADALGMAIGSSKAQLHRARGLLRERLEGHA